MPTHIFYVCNVNIFFYFIEGKAKRLHLAQPLNCNTGVLYNQTYKTYKNWIYPLKI